MINVYMHLFMLIVFVIGVLLIIITFSAYSKLTEKCTLPGLRTKLRMAIGLGTAFVTITVGYAICINAKGCNCDFGKKDDWKLYFLMLMLMTLGGCMLALSLGIKKDLKTGGCDISLGVADALMGISIAQIALPVLYVVFVLVSKKTNKPDEPKKKEKGQESQAREADSKRVATNSRRLARYKKTIAVTEEQLANVNDKIEEARSKDDDPTKEDEALQHKLETQLSKYKSDLQSLSSAVEDSSPGDSGNSGKSVFGASWMKNSS